MLCCTRALRTRVQYLNQRLDRSERGALGCIKQMLGIYSTSPTSHVGLAARVDGYHPSHLDELVAKRKVVRIGGVRGSGFVLPVEVVPVVVSATRVRRERYFKDMLSKTMDRKTYERIATRIERLLEGNEMVAAEIRKRLVLKDPNLDEAIRYVLATLTAECRLVVSAVQGTWRSNLARYALWPDVLPDVDPWALDIDEARSQLALRYFEAHGPATIEDFAWWSGLKADAKEVVHAAGVPECADGFYGKLRDAPAPRTVRLLPYWDAALLTHRHRDHVIAPEHHGHVYDASGNPCPTVVVNGRVQGVWDLTISKSDAVLRVAPLNSFSEATWKKVRSEADRLVHALDLPDLHFLRCKNPPSIKDGPRNLFMSPLRTPDP